MPLPVLVAVPELGQINTATFTVQTFDIDQVIRDIIVMCHKTIGMNFNSLHWRGYKYSV